MAISLEAAERLFDLANGALVVGLVISAAATVAVIWLGNIKEAHLKRDVGEAHKRAAEANLGAAEANARALEATASAAQANGQIAESNRRAEADRLARLKLEAIVAPRSLSPAQLEEITKALRLFKFQKRTVNIISYALDLEGATLAQQIGESLHAAGLNAVGNIGGTMAMGGFATGVQVSGTDKELRDAIAAALRDKGGLAVSFSHAEGEAQVLIGIKPAPKAK